VLFASIAVAGVGFQQTAVPDRNGKSMPAGICARKPSRL
jgi:hypothetical protein